MKQRFIQSFPTSGVEQTAIENKELGKPYVAYIEDGNYIDWNTKGIDYASMPLTFDIISGGTILWTSNQGQARTIEYSKDAGSTWEQITSTHEGAVINVAPGEKLIFKGNNPIATDVYNHMSFKGTAIYNVYGNINSIRFWDNYLTGDVVYNSYVYYYLFAESGVYDASNLYLPEPAIDNMYHGLFSDSVYLAKAPRLRGNTLTNKCYYFMFFGCTNLTQAPELPATTLAQECYARMFQGCTSLTQAPALPATTLANYCYEFMFRGCSSLTTAPELPATELAPACYSSMFERCTSLTTAPILRSKTISHMGYDGMFGYCSNLQRIECYATDISATQATRNWVWGVPSTGTFVKAAGVEWTTGVGGIPTGWTVVEV